MRFRQRPSRFVRWISGSLGLAFALVCTPSLELAHASQSHLRFYHPDYLGSTETGITAIAGNKVIFVPRRSK